MHHRSDGYKPRGVGFNSSGAKKRGVPFFVVVCVWSFVNCTASPTSPIFRLFRRGGENEQEAEGGREHTHYFQ